MRRRPRQPRPKGQARKATGRVRRALVSLWCAVPRWVCVGQLWWDYAIGNWFRRRRVAMLPPELSVDWQCC